MKKIIWILGVIGLSVIAVLNIFFTTYLNTDEYAEATLNSPLYIVGLLLLGIGIVIITNVINHKLNKIEVKKAKKVKIILLVAVLVIYTTLSILLIIFVNPAVEGDQIHAYNLAQMAYDEDMYNYLSDLSYAQIPLSQYVQGYTQQLTFAFVFGMLFKLLHIDGYGVIRAVNVIACIAIIFAIYQISKQISKKYKSNIILPLTVITTFISIPLLSTFIYGDISSIALCMYSIFFTMKYNETRKIKYIIFSGILSMLAYMVRMNSVIFIIATVIYLCLNVFNDFREKNKNWKYICLLGVYIIIALVPSYIVKNYYIDKYNLDKTKSVPTVNYILMAMEESRRGNGWYSEDIGETALKEPEKAKAEYPGRIKERLKYFIENPEYTLEFYTMKTMSMWTENTYAAIRHNSKEEKQELIEPLTFYQKTLLIVVCICSVIILIQNRKNISYELIFLITVFIGGLAFHTIWEAKSRYIIPYIVVLIPIIGVEIKTKSNALMSKYEK